MKTELAVLIAVFVTLASGQMYDRLYRDLKLGRVKDTIPMRSKRDTVNVSITLNPVKVNYLNTETGDAELDAWMILQWRDKRLTWSPSKYNNATQLRVPYSQIWSPDITLYNGRMDLPEFNAVVSSDGSIVKVPQSTIKTRCDVSSHSADGAVTCNLKFGSWAYNGLEIDLNLSKGGVDVTEYKAGRWEILHANARRNEVRYSCCPEPYIHAAVSLVFLDTKDGNGWFGR